MTSDARTHARTDGPTHGRTDIANPKIPHMGQDPVGNNHFDSVDIESQMNTIDFAWKIQLECTSYIFVNWMFMVVMFLQPLDVDALEWLGVKGAAKDATLIAFYSTMQTQIGEDWFMRPHVLQVHRAIEEGVLLIKISYANVLQNLG